MKATLAQKAEARRLYNKLHPEKVRASNARRKPAAHEWYLENRDHVIARTKVTRAVWIAANPEEHRRRLREWHLKREYGITPEDYDRLLAAQGGVCALCKKAPKTKRLAIDHDHVTHRIRGLLCTFDNHRFVGRNRDPEKFRAAAEYLEHPPAEGVLYAVTAA